MNQSSHINKARKGYINKDLDDVRTERIERDLIKGQGDVMITQEEELLNESQSKIAYQSYDQNLEETKDKDQSISLIQEANQDNKNEAIVVQTTEQKKQPLIFWVYGGNHPETVAEGLMRRGNWQQGREEDNIEKCNFLWKPFNYAADGYKRIDKRLIRNNQTFIYNHFEQLKGIVTKSGLIRSLKQYYFSNDIARQASYSVFDTTATTFLLAAGVDDSEQQEFIQRYKDITRGYAPKERIPLKHCMNNIWLVKPANANQGRGIEIFSDLDELLFFVNTRPQYTCCVVQKYIERPLLFKQRKFDIRVWALATCKNEVFFYKKGYLRTSSDDYSLSNGNNYVHLTNNCLQKFGSNYGAHEEGNTVGFEVFQQYLDEQFSQYGLKVDEHFIPRMKDIIIDSFLSVKHQLNPNRRKNCFELFGYDFLIDEDFRLWLIEINTNPYFGVPNNYIANLLPKMMDDLLDIVVDPIYPPDIKPTSIITHNQYPLDCSTPNEFEIIYCEGGSAYSSGPLNKRRPFTTSLYPVPELAQQVGPKAPKQDIKYLKQFKVQGGNLSTLNYKNKKNQSSTNLQEQTSTQTKKSSQLRSKSMINNKYTQNQGTQQNKSKSISKTITTKPVNDGIASQSSNTNILSATSRRNTHKMNILNSSVSELKQDQLSKTPKNTQSFKGKNTQILTTIVQSNKTERQTPNAKIGINILHQIAERTSSMRRDLSNNNTTKESTSQGINSHTSSQDQLLFQVKEQHVATQQSESNPNEFDALFTKLMDKIKSDGNDLTKISANLEQLGMMMRVERIGQLAKENYIADLVNISMGLQHIPYQVTSFIIDMIYKLSLKFQVSQMLIKTRILQQILVKYNKCKEDESLKCNILKIFMNISCIKDIKQIQIAKTQLSPRLNGGVTGVQILKEQQYKRAIDKGIILILISNMAKYKQLIGDLSQVISMSELHQIIGQLEKEQLKRVNQSQINLENNNENDLATELKLDFKNQKLRLNTDPEEISPRQQDSNTFINQLQNHKKNDSFKNVEVIKFNLSFDAKKRVVSRSERLIDKEKKSGQQSSQNSQQLTPKPEIININYNQEMNDLVFSCIDLNQSLKTSRDLFNKVSQDQSQMIINGSPNKVIQEYTPPSKSKSKTVQQSITTSPLKKVSEQINNKRKESQSPFRKSVQVTNHNLILKDTMFIESPTQNLVVHSAKQGAILNAQYYTPEKQKGSFKLDQKEVPYQNQEEVQHKKSNTILSAFLSNNVSLSHQQQLNCSSSLNQMNINHLNNHLNQSNGSKYYKNISYQQETSSSNQKKQLASKYIPILKDKKYVPSQLQQQVSSYQKGQTPYYVEVEPQNEHKNRKYQHANSGSQLKYQESQSNSRISSRASSKQIIQNRDSLISDYQKQLIGSQSKKRLSELAKPYSDSLIQKNNKAKQNSIKNIMKSETKRPPRHNNYLQNSMSQQNNKEEYISNLRTYQSIDDNSIIMIPPKDFDETYDAFGTSEGVPNKTMVLDTNQRMQETKVATTGRANNGPQIPTNLFYPKNNGDSSIKSEHDSDQHRRMSSYSTSQQAQSQQVDNKQIKTPRKDSNLNRSNNVVVTGDDRHLFRKQNVNQKIIIQSSKVMDKMR